MDNNLKDILNRYENKTKEITPSPTPWTGFRELVLVEKVQECEDIISFYFKSKDGKGLVKHSAGQFLPFKIKTDDEKVKGVIRTYSLSIKPNEEMYRISVKRVPGGLISNYLHDELEVGSIIEAMTPTGIFTLKKSNSKMPLVLVSAGIGITPLISMLYESSQDFSEIHFIQAVQHSKMQPFGNDIKELSKSEHITNHVFYSAPLPEDIQGVHYDETGFVTKEWVEKNLPLNSEFYFCGPPPFMKGINKALLSLGVDRDRIHYEFFGNPQDMD